MKFIRPKDPQSIIRYMTVEGPLVEKWLELVEAEKKESGIEDLEITDVSEHWFDQGGIVGKEEPRMYVELDGFKYGVFLRHADDSLLAALRQPRTKSTNGILPAYIFVPGFVRGILLTPETGSRLAELFEAEMEEKKTEIEEAWNTYYSMLDRVNDGELRVLPRNMDKS